MHSLFSTGSAMMLEFFVFRDPGLITLDACVGLALAFWLYALPAATTEAVSEGAASLAAAFSCLISYQATA
jgi:hypothetical protein